MSMLERPTFETFCAELQRLVGTFEKNLSHYKSKAYDEASLRQEFLNPFFRALGWDVENTCGLIPQHRQVEIESRTRIAGRQKRADYLFRTYPLDRFVCEAKKPADELQEDAIFQAKRYAWNKGLPLALLTDFEELKIFIVGTRPERERPEIGLWKAWRFTDYLKVANEIWRLLSYEAVISGSIEDMLASLPSKSSAAHHNKARQRWLFKPERARALDTDFLNFLDEARRELASDLLRHNNRDDLLEGTRLNDAVQRILDRLLFLRICEDRDIDTGRSLGQILETFQRDRGVDLLPTYQPPLLHEEPPAHYGSSGLRSAKNSLWHALVRHFRSLDRRPPSSVPFFNGNLFKPHFSEELVVGDDWLEHFLQSIGDLESPYLFNYIPVEILGTIYERFLGKIVRPHGRGVTIEEKHELRKKGGVYYTPRFIVDFIVTESVGKLLTGKTPEEVLQLKILDPACGSGSFLIRVFEVLCEHCQQYFTAELNQMLARKNTSNRVSSESNNRFTNDSVKAAKAAWQRKRRQDCWLDETTGDVHLTVDFKRRVLQQTIFGVDLDPQAVEVTQMSLYLKMLDGENRTTLAKELELIGEERPILPLLEKNIKCGNSLVSSDFSSIPEDLICRKAFDWPVQFPDIIKGGGFDAVIGNPPYGHLLDNQEVAYLSDMYSAFKAVPDIYLAFILRAVELAKPDAPISFIVPSAWLGGPAYKSLREELLKLKIETLVSLPFDVFPEAYVDTAIIVLIKRLSSENDSARCFTYPKKAKLNMINIPIEKYDIVPLSFWRESPDFKLSLSYRMASLYKRLCEQIPTRFKDFAEMKRGVLFNSNLLTSYKVSEKYHPYFEGDVYRYWINVVHNHWVEYGPRMREYPKEFKWFEGRRLLLRRLVNRQQRLMCAITEETFITNKNIYSIRLRQNSAINIDGEYYLLALLNSRLISALYLNTVQQATKDDFPQVTIADIMNLPCPIPQNDQINKITWLSKKMTELEAKAHASKHPDEKLTLENAIKATDQALDACIYGLYGLTKDEIAQIE